MSYQFQNSPLANFYQWLFTGFIPLDIWMKAIELTPVARVSEIPNDPRGFSICLSAFRGLLTVMARDPSDPRLVPVQTPSSQQWTTVGGLHHLAPSRLPSGVVSATDAGWVWMTNGNLSSLQVGPTGIGPFVLLPASASGLTNVQIGAADGPLPDLPLVAGTYLPATADQLARANSTIITLSPSVAKAPFYVGNLNFYIASSDTYDISPLEIELPPRTMVAMSVIDGSPTGWAYTNPSLPNVVDRRVDQFTPPMRPIIGAAPPSDTTGFIPPNLPATFTTQGEVTGPYPLGVSSPAPSLVGVYNTPAIFDRAQFISRVAQNTIISLNPN